MSFVLSGTVSQSRDYEFRPTQWRFAYGIGNYIQSLRDLCYNSDQFVDASRVYDRFKIEGGSMTFTLHIFNKDPSKIDSNDSSLYGLHGAVRYGKNLNATVSPNSVYENSNWLFPSRIFPMDYHNRYMPYTESVTIPVKTGFTTFKKCFGNMYNALMTLAMFVSGPSPPPMSMYNQDLELALRIEWKFFCLGEGSAPSTINWVPCMHFQFDRRQGVRVRNITW